MMSMTRRAFARSATISAGTDTAVPRKTRLAQSCTAALQHTRLGAVAYGRICPVHVWPVLRCPPRTGTLERDLFLKVCITEPALARMRSYEEENITSPSRSIVVEASSVNHD